MKKCWLEIRGKENMSRRGGKWDDTVWEENGSDTKWWCQWKEKEDEGKRRKRMIQEVEEETTNITGSHTKKLKQISSLKGYDVLKGWMSSEDETNGCSVWNNEKKTSTRWRNPNQEDTRRGETINLQETDYRKVLGFTFEGIVSWEYEMRGCKSKQRRSRQRTLYETVLLCVLKQPYDTQSWFCISVKMSVCSAMLGYIILGLAGLDLA